jgi:hypothetical protein
VLVTAASGGSSLFTQYRPFAILKPKNRKTETWCWLRPHQGALCCIVSVDPLPFLNRKTENQNRKKSRQQQKREQQQI